MKYTLTNKRILFRGRELFRIKHVNGLLGGFVESERNLSQEGSCWVRPSGKVFDFATVVDDATVNGVVGGSAIIAGNTTVGQEASIDSGYHMEDVI